MTGAARPLRLATRGSPLALRQAGLVAGLLRRADPGVDVDVVVCLTEGDRRAGESLERIGGKGVFAKEVQAAVADGRADIAVHSAKDLPPRPSPGLTLAAVPVRADHRDALVGSTLAALGAGATVATGSARRRAQLANLRPDLTFSDLRGNMDTRLRRAADGSVVVVVAKAAFDRLGWSERLDDVLSPHTLLPQVGQGALAIECRTDDAPTRERLAAIDDPSTHSALLCERAFLDALGADCAAPVGAFAALSAPGVLSADGVIASFDGKVVVRARLEAGANEPEALGTRLAHHLVAERGGAAVLDDPATATGGGR